MRTRGGDVLLANREGGGLHATITLPQRLIKVTERAQPKQIDEARESAQCKLVAFDLKPPGRSAPHSICGRN